ncbi:MAG: hypothetical protein ACON35_03785 [Candidatus Marinamargulisbacteria bacterium]
MKLLLFTIVLLITGCGLSSNDSSSSHPDISTFKTNPTDQFLVNMNDVADGQMHRGKNATSPHPGAHINFKNNAGGTTWPNGTPAKNYPPIYAFADGTISSIDTYYEVTNPQKTHYRYGIRLDFASAEGKTISMSYSIEPMVDPGDETFYQDFILVTKGDTVKKGDIIAYMYISPDATIGTDHHIHFNLLKSQSGGSSIMQAPAIFTTEVMTQFLAKLTGGDHNHDGGKNTGVFMDDCMGYKIAADENPYEAVASDCLK